MTTNKAEQVRRRRVFYIPGYDPIPPRRYRELYRKESVRQAKISGYQIEIAGKKPGTDPFGWHVLAEIEGGSVDADVDVLVWSDIVRTSMSNTILATYLQMLRTAWIYIATGTLRRLMRLRKGPVIAALYPVGMLFLQLLLAILVGVAIIKGLGVAAALIPVGDAAKAWIITPLTFVAGAWGGERIMNWFRAQDGRFYTYYLVHNFTFSAKLGGANPPELEARMRAFADLIADALTQNLDEVLVVGHSSGAHLAVSVLADLLRSGRVPPDGPALGFLTLGHVVPMVSFLPQAHRLRADLRYLSTSDDLAWIDVSAPGDGCSFAMCDPVSVSGVAPQGKKWPLVFSAAFTQTLSPERWAELRWRFFRLHFQYLCAFDRPGDYDYFRITAGPQTLAARYAGRAASGSRIDKPVSKYRSVAAR